MNRPTDWAALDLDADPTPGDPFSVRELARKFLEFAADVDHANENLTALTSSWVAISWQGQSGTAFRDELAEFPGQLQKLANSYRLAGNALSAFNPDLGVAQVRADNALARGRDARARRDHAQTLIGPARIAFTSVASTISELTSAAHVYPADVPQPDPAGVAQAIRNRDTVRAKLDLAQSSVDSAQDDLDAARRLALTAKQMREDAAETCVHAIRSASHAGLKNRSWHSWEGLLERAGRFWHAAVRVAKISVAVLGIVVLIVGGPLAWVIFAAALVVLANTLMEYAAGRASLWDVLFALADCIPGPVGLTTTAGAARAVRGARQSWRDGRIFARISPAAGRTRLAAMTASLRGGRARTTIVLRRLLPRGIHRVAKDTFAVTGPGERVAARPADLDDALRSSGNRDVDQEVGLGRVDREAEEAQVEDATMVVDGWMHKWAREGEGR